MSLTLSTAWYRLGGQSKYTEDTYKKWINIFLSQIKNFNLVIYTNSDSLADVKKYESSNIVIVVKELSEFYNYKYKTYWITNHDKNSLLRDTCWELNMLWSEKISFVKSTIENSYFRSTWYGWCDIGYFRCRKYDITAEQQCMWPNRSKLEQLDETKIHYACVRPSQIRYVFQLACKLNDKGLPETPLPPDQVTIGGGFFLIQPHKIDWWHHEYDDKLRLYFENNYLVKDDQIILASIIPNRMKYFKLYTEADPKYDNWFMFQRLLL